MAKRTSVTSRRRSRPSTPGVLYPLDLMYAREGVPPPRVKELSPYDIPLPYRSLLVHGADMTITLEQHFGGRVALRVLSTFFVGEWYSRRVLLVQEYSGRPVQMGAIRMNFETLSPRVRTRVLKNEVPLGRILRDSGVSFRTEPKAYLAVTPNSEMMGVFWMREPRTLYGRQTEVIHRDTKIGDIFEVLPLV